MDGERLLLTTPAADWRAEHVIAFDYYDGPRQGVCRLAVPPVEFVFRLLDERATEDDLDDRVCSVELLLPGSVARVAELMAQLVRRLSDETARAEIEAALDAIERQATATSVVFYTRDFETFLGRWHADAAGDGDRPWFRLIDGKDEARTTAEARP